MIGASVSKSTADAWMEANRGRLPKALLLRIRADGNTGTAGPRGRRQMTNPTADWLVWQVVTSGVGSQHAREYFAIVLRWHYGFEAGGSPIASTARLSGEEMRWVRVRAHEIVTTDRPAWEGPELVNLGLAR